MMFREMSDEELKRLVAANPIASLYDPASWIDAPNEVTNSRGAFLELERRRSLADTNPAEQREA